MNKATNVAIIGVGFIGGSLGMALRRSKGNRYHVTGIGRDKKKLSAARRRGAVDDFTVVLPEGVREADIVVVCTPVDRIVPMVQDMLPYVRRGAVITDVGSSKSAVTGAVAALLARLPKEERPSFIGAHPMAGSEKTGVRFADPGLYKGAAVVVTPPAQPDKKSVEIIKKLWEDAGAEVIAMPAGEHDRLVAYTSHLPHLLAFSLCGAVPSHRAAARLVAGSFKDMTRIADSDPHSWAAICASNNKAVAAAVKEFIARLKNIAASLDTPGKLETAFTRARTARQKLLARRS